jgi:hypothetical protein
MREAIPQTDDHRKTRRILSWAVLVMISVAFIGSIVDPNPGPRRWESWMIYGLVFVNVLVFGFGAERVPKYVQNAWGVVGGSLAVMTLLSIVLT